LELCSSGNKLKKADFWRDIGNSAYVSLLKWLFPTRCIGCGSLGESICASCANEISFILEPFCSRCGTPFLQKARSTRHTCIETTHLSQIRSASTFTGIIRRAILSLKYHNNHVVADSLISLCSFSWPIQEWKVDIIIPVPTSKQKERTRGYNQAKILADAFSRYSGLPTDTNLLRKSDNVLTQVGLSMKERKQNIKNAFISKPCNGKILLLDDVCTTGATMESAAHALREAGAQQVFGATVARTIRRGS
jgi:ComF family protein